MPEFVRVKDRKSKHEMTVTAANAEALGDAVEVLDKPAVDGNGKPLPGKPHTETLGVPQQRAFGAQKSASAADPKEES